MYHLVNYLLVNLRLCETSKKSQVQHEKIFPMFPAQQSRIEGTSKQLYFLLRLVRGNAINLGGSSALLPLFFCVPPLSVEPTGWQQVVSVNIQGLLCLQKWGPWVNIFRGQPAPMTFQWTPLMSGGRGSL